MAKFIDSEPAKLKAYYRLKDDGEGYRCRDCGKTFAAELMLLPAPFTPVCVECLGEDWINEATLLGVK